jgi:hypothetical protein
MKKHLLTLGIIVASLLALPAHAAQFWYDTITNLPGGCITTNPPSVNFSVTNFSNWYPHGPGSAFNGTPYDMVIVTNNYTSGAAISGKHLRVNGLNAAYIMRLFDPVNTNTFTSGTLYASFVANANFVTAPGVGTYFATFNSADGTLGAPATLTNGFMFRGRVFEIGATNVYPFTTRVSGCFRYGVANALNDPSRSGGNLNQTLFVPIDLKGNIDYQVVLKYDIDNASATLWVNPATEGDVGNVAGPTSDNGAVTNAIAGLLFRQIAPGGTVDIRDIAVGTTFADVMTNVLANTTVQVATNFNTVTNFPGNPALLEVFASSIGGGALSYQWYQIAGGVTNAVTGANSQTMLINELASTDTGNYFCAVTNAGGNGAVSRTNFFISVNPAAGLGFASQAPSQFGGVGGQLTLSCTITGSGPYSIQWYFNGNPLIDGSAVTSNPGDASLVSGALSPTLLIKGLSTNETGDFSVTVTTTAAVTPNSITSSNAHITVNPPTPVSIAYLRSLEDHVNWQPTDTASVYVVSNAVVISFTNVTSGSTASYFVEDGTAGINVFVTGDPSFRPTLGDLLSVGGTLSGFNNDLELFVNPAINPYVFYTTSGHTNVLPAPQVFAPFSLTNNAGLMETNFEGRLVMLTNVGFDGTVASLTLGAANVDLFVTNSSGRFDIHFSAAQDLDFNGKTLPRFAYSIVGYMDQNLSGTTYANKVYRVNPTRFGDIVGTPPPPVTVSAEISGTNIVLNWTAVPYVTNYDAPGAYSYSVFVSPTVEGPYSPVVTGKTFNSTTGTYSEPLGPGPKYFRVGSP